MSNVRIIEEMPHPNHKDGFKLCLQWCEYPDAQGCGFRFIWRRPNGNLAPARGQTRIPALDDAELLISRARAAGWGNNKGDDQTV